jgi:hypothetical protein
MIWNGDAGFIKWGMKAVLQWENDIIPQPLWHIHKRFSSQLFQRSPGRLVGTFSDKLQNIPHIFPL